MSREPQVVEVRFGLHNEYKLTTHKGAAPGSIEPIPGTAEDRTDWFSNLITDHGMDYFGITESTTLNWARGLRVGTGNATPDNADTNLQAIVATTVTRTAVSSGRQIATSPYYIEKVMTYRFGTGVAAGNLAELGLVGSGSDGSGAGGALNAGTNVVTRALIVDGGGSPTTVTVLSDEILDVTVRQRLYIPMSDVTGTLTPTGGVAPSTDWVVRACEIDQNHGVNQPGWNVNQNDNTTSWSFYPTNSSNGNHRAFVGGSSAIGSMTDQPTGTVVMATAPSVAAYSNGNHYFDMTMSFGLGTASTGINAAGGIGAALISLSGTAAFQIGFTPRLMKTHDMLFNFTLRVKWERYTP